MSKILQKLLKKLLCSVDDKRRFVNVFAVKCRQNVGWMFKLLDFFPKIPAIF